MVLYKRGPVWWMRFTYMGRQVRKPTETSDKRLAEKIYHKVMTQVAEGKWFERQPDDNKTFVEMIDKYMTEYSITKTSSGQVRDKVIAGHLTSFFGNRQLKEIAPSLIVDYKTSRRKKRDGPCYYFPGTLSFEKGL